MSEFIDIDFNDAREFETLPDGERVEVQVVKAEAKPGKSDSTKTVLHLRLEVQGGGLYNDIYEYYTFPTASDKTDDLKGYTRRVNQLKNMLECLDVALENVSPMEFANRMEGKIGYVIVKQEAGQDGQPQNRVKQWLKRR